MVAAAAAVALVGTMVFLWLMLPQSVQDRFSTLQRATVIAFLAAMVAVLHALFRTLARAEAPGLTIVNGYKTRRFEWAEIVSVSFNPNRPWALLDLADGDTVVVMAIQNADGARASRSARELAGVIAEQSRTDRDR
ncbi:MAG: PH domain-containing protein [Nocardioidaceae bacterium]|nr:PH domain-containing protein [Nocardioidaceae bacterium]